MLMWLLLLMAIILEVIGTTSLRYSNGFTQPLYTFITLGCYASSFFLLAKIVQVIPIGITYAIWSGVGILFIALIGRYLFKQQLDLAAIIGIVFILIGVLIINLFSHTAGH
ncbi:DMT family transporter [Gallibacterium melopsittaci]|uniref:DMT family transporter n=1 Tax=Gallibacterium melopsittaci TaxID=516063 RepID=A0ABV6HXI4_9PAST